MFFWNRLLDSKDKKYTLVGKKMKIVFITHYSDLYGANLSMLGLAEMFIEQYDIDVYIICPQKGKVVDVARKKGIHVKCIPYIYWQGQRFITLKKLLRVIWNPICIELSCCYVKKISPDVIHSNSSVADLGVVISKRMKIPCVWHLREFGEEDYNLKYVVPSKKIGELYSSANRIIAISEYLRASYKKKYPVLDISVVYNGVKNFSVKRKKHLGCNFCVIGRITEQKGQYQVLKAVVELIKSKRDGFHLYIVGEGKDRYVNKLMEYVFSNDLDEYVTFTGYVEDISDFLCGMDVGIMSSKCEAFGRVTVEYMYAEMQVIATNYGGTKEIIGDNAMYYDFGDFICLADKMGKCMDNQYENRDELRLMAEKKFNQRVCTKNILNIYKEMGIRTN